MASGRVTFDFAGADVLVTGGTRGIGAAIAMGFANAGAHVTITGTRDRLSDYDSLSPKLSYHRCDLGEPDHIDSLVSVIPSMDVLINNAGIALKSPQSQTPDGFEYTIAVNLSSIYRLSHGLLPLLKLNRGCIVNIGSLYGNYANHSPGYSAAKAAVANLTKSLASMYAAEGVRVNNIAPGWTATDLTIGRQRDEAFSETVIAHTPIGRWGKPSDIVGSALFLASNQAAFITGVTLPVDGGFSTRW